MTCGQVFIAAKFIIDFEASISYSKEMSGWREKLIEEYIFSFYKETILPGKRHANIMCSDNILIHIGNQYTTFEFVQTNLRKLYSYKTLQFNLDMRKLLA